MTPKLGERLFPKEYASVLLEIATEELVSARILINAAEGRKETAIYTCQQVIEKCLKAVLCSHEIPIPLIHDLAALVAKMPDTLAPPYGYSVSRYNDYAGILRYEKGHARITKADLAAALEVASEVLSWGKLEIDKIITKNA